MVVQQVVEDALQRAVAVEARGGTFLALFLAAVGRGTDAVRQVYDIGGRIRCQACMAQRGFVVIGHAIQNFPVRHALPQHAHARGAMRAALARAVGQLANVVQQRA